MKVSVREVCSLARGAESAGQPDLAEALFAVAGRMGRSPGGDGYDTGITYRAGLWLDEDGPDEFDLEPDLVAAIRGRTRADRLLGPCPAGPDRHGRGEGC